MRRLLLLASLASLGYGAPPLLDGASRNAPKPAVPTPIIELASPGDNPARGSLAVKLGEKRETIEFSGSSPYYIVGMVLHSSALPEDFRSEFKGRHIIQFTFGTLGGSVGEKVPHWASLGVVTPKIPGTKRTFLTSAPSNAKESYAQFSIKSPGTPDKQTDEEKLKTMFFSQSGTLNYSPIGSVEDVKLVGERGRIAFKRQKVALEFNSILATPFNPAEGDLKGRVETYVYWPARKESQQLTQNLASASLRNLFSRQATREQPPPTEGVNRAVSGSTQTTSKGQEPNGRNGSVKTPINSEDYPHQ